MSPLLTQPEHSDVKLLELELGVGLLGLVDGGLRRSGMTGTLLLRLSLLSRIGMQGRETALRGTTTLFWATGTLAQRSLRTFGDDATAALDVSDGVVPLVVGASIVGDFMGSICEYEQPRDEDIKKDVYVIIVYRDTTLKS